MRRFILALRLGERRNDRSRMARRAGDSRPQVGLGATEDKQCGWGGSARKMEARSCVVLTKQIRTAFGSPSGSCAGGTREQKSRLGNANPERSDASSKEEQRDRRRAPFSPIPHQPIPRLPAPYDSRNDFLIAWTTAQHEPFLVARLLLAPQLDSPSRVSSSLPPTP